MNSQIQIFRIGLIVLAFAATIRAGEPEDIEFRADVDGSKQRYVVVEPAGFRPNELIHVLIALHGHGSDRWQFVRDGRDECRAAREAAKRWKMLYVSPDYRAKTSWMGPKAEADLVQIVAELKDRYRAGKVIVCGGSMGATAALTFAALHPGLVDGVVAFNGTANIAEYDKFQDAIAESFGGTKREVPDEYRKRSAELNFQKLTMPIAATTGGRDEVVPPASVLRLVEKLKPTNPHVLSIHRPEGGHSTGFEDCSAAMRFVMEKAIGPVREDR